MKIGVLLSGCGVYDGSEIHEAVLTLLAIEEKGADAICIAPNVDQHHVINHITGDEMNETRNTLLEAARIARGDIKSLDEIDPADIDALIVVGGFGAAKNLTKWAFSGPDGEILPKVKLLIVNMVNIGKPVGGICMGPTVIAKAFEGSKIKPSLTVGSVDAESPYDIQDINDGMVKTGAKPVAKKIDEVEIDVENKIVSAPCYMMKANIWQIYNNVTQTIEGLIALAE